MERKKPPPLPPRRDAEVVRVEEDTPAPSTQRHPILPPAPRVPPEPFRWLGQPTNAELLSKLGEALSVCADVLALQRKLALQYEGVRNTVNARFDVFHEELALMRGVLIAEDEEAPEEQGPAPSTTRQKLGVGGKYTAAAVVGAFVLRLVEAILQGGGYDLFPR